MCWGRRSLSRFSTAGLFVLVTANTLHFVLLRHRAASGHLADLADGCLYGLAIGLLLFGVWRQSRGEGSA